MMKYWQKVWKIIKRSTSLAATMACKYFCSAQRNALNKNMASQWHNVTHII